MFLLSWSLPPFFKLQTCIDTPHPHSIELLGAYGNCGTGSESLTTKQRIVDYAKKISQDGVYLELLDAMLVAVMEHRTLCLVMPAENGENLVRNRSRV